MPVYAYHCESCGKETDGAFQSYEDRTPEIDCKCGAKAVYDFGATVKSQMQTSGERQHLCRSLGCNPEDVGQRKVDDAKMGSMADGYRSDGQLVFNSAQHKDSYLKDRGFHVKD